MKITKDSVVQFHYTLKNDEGELIESSEGLEPTASLHGHGSMIKGMEKAMEGREAGDEFSISVEPEDGYGERFDDSIQRIPVKHLIGKQPWRPGMIATVQTEKGQRQVSIVKVGKFMVKVDTNHPLAGQTLHFDIQIVNVREASAEEISHGHAHGAGGHQH